jgi:hypothetical protein
VSIQRVDFVGFTVLGYRSRTQQAYTPKDWPGWTCSVKGQAVLLEGEGRVVEVPRGKCVITSVPEKEPTP